MVGSPKVYSETGIKIIKYFITDDKGKSNKVFSRTTNS